MRAGTMAVLVIASFGCGNDRALPLTTAPAAIESSVAWTIELLPDGRIAPEGTDARPRFTAWRVESNGARTPVELPAPVVYGLMALDAAWIVDSEDVLWRVADRGAPRWIARDVVGGLAASPRGDAFGYVRRDGLEAIVRVRTVASDRVVARGLGSAGALRFTPEGDELIFVGSVPNGVAGLWSISLGGHSSGARCLTNCTLRAGEPWVDPQVPLPSGPESLRFTDGLVLWTGSDGRPYEVAR